MKCDLVYLLREAGFYEGKKLSSRYNICHKSDNFYYKFRDDGGVDIVEFRNRRRSQGCFFYRYSAHNLTVTSGVNFEKDTPSFEGNNAVKALESMAEINKKVRDYEKE